VHRSASAFGGQQHQGPWSWSDRQEVVSCWVYTLELSSSPLKDSNTLNGWPTSLVQFLFSSDCALSCFCQDLTLLYSYEHPKQPVTRLPPSFTSPASWLSEGEAEICNLWDTGNLATDEIFFRNRSEMHLKERLHKYKIWFWNIAMLGFVYHWSSAAGLAW
jgi:hypothetical protein